MYLLCHNSCLYLVLNLCFDASHKWRIILKYLRSNFLIDHSLKAKCLGSHLNDAPKQSSVACCRYLFEQSCVTLPLCQVLRSSSQTKCVRIKL